MGENWDHCVEFARAMIISMVCFPFMPIALLYWYLHTEEVHQAWITINDEDNQEINHNEQEVQRDRQQLRQQVEETERFWDRLRMRFLRQYGLDSDSVN
jgi:uncharacterized protein YlxW (UPF0749 family)